jgi:hypothetical protein
MNNPFKNTSKEMIDAINNVINEQTNSKVFNIGGKVAQTIDFSSSVDDPEIYIKGLGVYRLSLIKKMIKQDLVRFTDMVGDKPSKDMLVMLTDVEGRRSSIYFAYRLNGLAEVEEFMNRPTIKRKITLLKKNSGG